MLKGYLLLLCGYVSWGLYPLYWSLTAHIPATEVTLQRIIWSVPVLLLLVFTSARRRSAFKAAISNPKTVRFLAITTCFICINWSVYLWAVTNQHILEASMGYFLTPLLNVAGGVIVFKETLDPLKRWAIGFAALGVAYYISHADGIPWIALVLGLSFSCYGILRKHADVDAIPALLVETLLAGTISLIWLIVLIANNQSEFLQPPSLSDFWLILGGVVTVFPLVWFTSGAKLLPMATVGILFFVAPSLQFISGVLIFHEPVDQNKLISFVGIWLGLSLYAWSLIKPKPAKHAAAAQPANPGNTA